MAEAVNAPQAGLSDEQQEIRRTRVGSSEIAALIPPMPDGTVVHPHGKGPMDVFASKMGAGKPQTVAQRWGQLVEAPIVTIVCETQGVALLPPLGTLIHPRYPWLCLTPDARTIDANGRRRLLEAKNSGRFMTHLWGPEGTADVPIGYAAQVQITLSGLLELDLVDDDEGDLGASIGGMAPAIYVIPHKPDLVEKLAGIARVFVEKHLNTGEPPEQGWESEAAEKWLRKKYPHSIDPMLDATPEDVKRARQISYGKKRIGKWETVIEEARNRLRARIGSALGITGIATNKCRKDGVRVLKLAREWSDK